MKELWQEICFILHGDITSSISEEMYEQKIIQSLEKMGWNRFRKEIILKQSVQLGSAGRIVPDIIVKSLHNNQSFVIEVKKPSAEINNPSHKNQLFSYMRQLKLEYGVLIGNQIQIYYDGKLKQEENPVLLKSITFSESSQNEWLFTNLFHKDKFSYETLEIYAKERITSLENEKKEKELLNLLLSLEYKNKIKEIVAENLQQDFDKEIIENVLNEITIIFSNKVTVSPPIDESECILQNNNLMQQISLSTRTHQQQVGNINITEPVVLIRTSRLFRQGMSDKELYEITRGVWKIGENRKRVEYAFCVADGIVREIYKIQKWQPAGTTLYETSVMLDANIKDKWVGRWEFIGQIAPDTIRNKYIGKSVADYFVQGNANPINYLNI